MKLAIPVDHPAFAGHFPGRPILPGVVLLDAVIRAVAGGHAHEAARAWSIVNAKFHATVAPGQSLTLEQEPLPDGAVRFTIRSETEPVASGLLRPVAGKDEYGQRTG